MDSTCVGAIIMRQFVNLVLRIRRQTIRSRRLLCILPRSFKTASVDAVIIPRFINERQQIRVNFSVFINIANDHFFNDTFKNTPIKVLKKHILFQDCFEFSDPFLQLSFAVLRRFNIMQLFT